MAEDGPPDFRGLTQGPQTNGEKQTTVFVRWGGHPCASLIVGRIRSVTRSFVYTYRTYLFLFQGFKIVYKIDK